MLLLSDLREFARRSPPEQLKVLRRVPAMVRCRLEDLGWNVPHLGNDRTAYIIGLFGSGRWYVNQLMREHAGKRAKYFRPRIRLHPGPTSMIYSGHATLRYVCRDQALPSVTKRILEAVRERSADLIFVYRHPLDSLLSNWVWWRTHLRAGRAMTIWMAYRTTDELCADLDRDFSEFKAFAEGDPSFFAGAPGLPFLSFPEFVEETERYLQSATLTLRLEDFVIDPSREFSKILEVMGVDLELSRLHLPAPKTKPYRYLAVNEKVPRFRNFINGMGEGTIRGIEKAGYVL